MKYYDIEIFNESNIITLMPFYDHGKVYDELSPIFNGNDSYFLKALYDKVKDWEDGFMFSKILFWFYHKYTGNAKVWLEYTMNIVYMFEDRPTDKLLKDELKEVLASKKSISGGRVAHKYEKELENAPHGKQKELFKKLAAKYDVTPNSIKQGLQRLREK